MSLAGNLLGALVYGQTSRAGSRVSLDDSYFRLAVVEPENYRTDEKEAVAMTYDPSTEEGRAAIKKSLEKLKSDQECLKELSQKI